MIIETQLKLAHESVHGYNDFRTCITNEQGSCQDLIALIRKHISVGKHMLQWYSLMANIALIDI